MFGKAMVGANGILYSGRLSASIGGLCEKRHKIVNDFEKGTKM